MPSEEVKISFKHCKKIYSYHSSEKKKKIPYFLPLTIKWGKMIWREFGEARHIFKLYVAFVYETEKETKKKQKSLIVNGGVQSDLLDLCPIYIHQG